MEVKLVAHTQGVGELKDLTVGEILAYVARVSNPGNQMNHETAPRLLNYCLRNGHWSVFEHCFFTFEITTSLAIAAQILRHRSAVFQQFSLRYAEAVDFETYPARRQDDKNRQNSVDDMSPADKVWFHQAQLEVQYLCMRRYQEALSLGIAKEQARFLLPTSTRTTMYMTGNVRTWLTYLKARTYEGAQLEHRLIAYDIKSQFLQECPELENVSFWDV